MNLHRTRPLALLLGLALIAGACSDDNTDNDAGTEPPTTTVVANPPTDDGGADGDDGASPESGGSPAFLSAYLGLVDLPATGIPLLEGVSGCDQEELDEGMPVVLSHPVDADTLDPADFVVTTASGDVAKPTCARLEPATEDGELQTVLLTGPLGTADDRPVRVQHRSGSCWSRGCARFHPRARRWICSRRVTRRRSRGLQLQRLRYRRLSCRSRRSS